MWADKNIGDTALLFLHGHDVDTKMYIYIDVQHLYSIWSTVHWILARRLLVALRAFIPPLLSQFK